MSSEPLSTIVARVSQSLEPTVEFIKRSQPPGRRLGVFASSFNPPTLAHAELMRRARVQFSLDEAVGLAGAANADKQAYECPLEDRLRMLDLALVGERHSSIGVSSHAYFVDMAEAFERVSPPCDLHFIIGFDTFERVLDRDDRYTPRYHGRFRDRGEALECLASRSRLIVAGRKGAGEVEVRRLLKDAPASLAERVAVLDCPNELGERSATEVRERRRSGHSITGLVAPAVEQYIIGRGLYVS